MSDSFQVTQAHRQHRLGAIERLNLRLFIDREHDRVVGRIQVEAHHITHLFDEEWIAGKLEASAAVGLDSKRLEDPVHGRFRESIGFGGLAYAPVTPRRRLVLQGAPE